MPAEQRWTCTARIQIPDIRACFRRYHFWYYVQPAKMLSARGWQDGEQFHPLVWKCCKGRNWFLVHSYTASSSNNAWHIVEQSLINIVCALYCMNKSGFLAPKRRKGAKIIGYQQANIHLFEEGAEKFTTHEAGCETATLRGNFHWPLKPPGLGAGVNSILIPHYAGMCNFGTPTINRKHTRTLSIDLMCGVKCYWPFDMIRIWVTYATKGTWLA